MIPLHYNSVTLQFAGGLHHFQLSFTELYNVFVFLRYVEMRKKIPPVP